MHYASIARMVIAMLTSVLIKTIKTSIHSHKRKFLPQNASERKRGLFLSTFGDIYGKRRLLCEHSAVVYGASRLRGPLSRGLPAPSPLDPLLPGYFCSRVLLLLGKAVPCNLQLSSRRFAITHCLVTFQSSIIFVVQFPLFLFVI